MEYVEWARWTSNGCLVSSTSKLLIHFLFQRSFITFLIQFQYCFTSLLCRFNPKRRGRVHIVRWYQRRNGQCCVLSIKSYRFHAAAFYEMSPELQARMEDATYRFTHCSDLLNLPGLIAKLGVPKETQWEVARKQACNEDMEYANPAHKTWTPFNVCHTPIHNPIASSVPLLFHHYSITVSSLFHHCIITVTSLFHHCFRS